MYVIPLTSEPNQNFRCTVPVDGKNITFIFDIQYNLKSQLWTMGLTDDKTGEKLVDSVPLLAGEYPAANLLEQYSHLKIGSACVVKIDPDIEAENPTADTLGTGFKLVWSNTL